MVLATFLSCSSPFPTLPSVIVALVYRKMLGFPRLKSQLLPQAELAFPEPLGALAAPSCRSGPLPSPRHTSSSHDSEPWDSLFCLPSLWSDQLLLILFKAGSSAPFFVKCALGASGGGLTPTLGSRGSGAPATIKAPCSGQGSAVAPAPPSDGGGESRAAVLLPLTLPHSSRSAPAALSTAPSLPRPSRRSKKAREADLSHIPVPDWVS